MQALAIIWAPIQTLERAAEERRVLLGFGVVGLCSALGLLGSIILVLGGVTRAQLNQSQLDLPQDVIGNLISAAEIGTIVLSATWFFASWIAISLLMQLTTRFFGGSGSFSAMLAVVGYSFMPLVLNGVLALFIAAGQVALDPGSTTSVAVGYLGTLIGYAFFFWQVALVVIGASFARRIGYGESAGSCAISCAGCFGSIIVIGIALAIVIPVILSAAGSGAQ
ncbi:hypothetical protein BH18ACT10_BH18ACT10_00380 [soil metagenome]|nr:YIP1 family protein [Rubrobacter sp.]